MHERHGGAPLSENGCDGLQLRTAGSAWYTVRRRFLASRPLTVSSPVRGDTLNVELRKDLER